MYEGAVANAWWMRGLSCAVCLETAWGYCGAPGPPHPYLQGIDRHTTAVGVQVKNTNTNMVNTWHRTTAGSLEP